MKAKLINIYYKEDAHRVTDTFSDVEYDYPNTTFIEIYNPQKKQKHYIPFDAVSRIEIKGDG